MIAHEITFIWPHTLIEIGIILLVAFISRQVLHRVIKQVLNRAARTPKEREDLIQGKSKTAKFLQKALPVEDSRQAARAKTLSSVLRSVTDIAIILITIFTLLRAVNVNIGPAIASVGIGGLAIGFGAQSLIKDVISGVFLIFEDQYGVGDYINVGNLSGTVLSVQLRITQLQDSSGQIWYVRNGEITNLGNVTQGWSSVVVNVPVNLADDPFRVIDVLKNVCIKVWKDPDQRPNLLEEPTVLGLTSFDTYQANYGISLKCVGNKQWPVERAVRALALEAFARNGVRAPATQVQEFNQDAQQNQKLTHAYQTSSIPKIAKPASWDEQ